jgi:Ca2+-binding EF-hand superfamily protein
MMACLATAFTALAAPGTRAVETDTTRLFQDLDADGDGQLAADEVGQQRRLLFKRLVRTGDEDGDGRITPAEFAAALEPVRAEKELVEKMGSRIPGADAFTVLLIKMDANGDRRLEPDEIPRDYKRLFEQMLRPGDGDKDGRLSQREIAQSAPRLGIMAQVAARRMGIDVEEEMERLPANQRMEMDRMDVYARPGQTMADPAQAAELFQRLDANGDKRLVADEAPEPLADRFDEMLERGDRDGDRALSKNEFMEISRRLVAFESAKVDPAAIRRTRRQLLTRFDRDDDGRLSVREVPRRLAQNFDRADADANGLLDEAELTKVAETMSRTQRFVGERGMFADPPTSERGPADRRARKKPGQKKAKRASD